MFPVSLQPRPRSRRRLVFNKFGLLGFLLCLVLCFAPGLATRGLAAHDITITGSTSMFPFLERAAEVFMSRGEGISISVGNRGSSDGARSMLDGISNLAGISRELTLREKALARKRGLSLQRVAVALGCVVPVVDPANPIGDLSLEQLRDIFTGKTLNWQEVGGTNQAITLLSRDTNSGTYEILREAVLGGAKLRRDALLLASNGAMCQAVGGNPYALGYVGLGYLNPRLKALKVGGVEPNLQNVKDGLYPLTRELAVLISKTPSPAVQKFVDFLLGPSGQRIAAEQGLIPLH